MRTAIDSRFALCTLCALAGCASVQTLDFPTARVTLVDHERTERSQRITFSPVDFFQEDNSDAKIACANRDWQAPVNAEGVARFEMKTSTHTFSAFSMDSASSKLEKMNRGFAICAERPGGAVEYLMTIGSGDTMFAAGATLEVKCEYIAAKWTCTAKLIG